jgi:hypothetical protein
MGLGVSRSKRKKERKNERKKEKETFTVTLTFAGRKYGNINNHYWHATPQGGSSAIHRNAGNSSAKKAT